MLRARLLRCASCCVLGLRKRRLCNIQVRMQHNGGLAKPGRVLSKFAKLVPPPQSNPVATSQAALQRALPKIAGLYR